MSSIDTKDLSAHLDDMKGKVDSFVQAQHAELAKLDAEAQAARADASEKKHGLQRDLVSAGVSAAAASKVLEETQSHVKTVEAEVKVAQSLVEESEPAKLAALESEKQRVTADVDTAKSDLEQRRCAAKEHILELTKGLQYFERLGLRMHSTPDAELTFEFTLIDPIDPDRVFKFSLRVDADNNYTVPDCSPPVPAVDSLLAKFNESNEFHKFVAAMRSEFKKAAA